MYYETLILGLVMGCIYSVTALGVNIIYGIMQIVNWAHGSILMISMFIVYGAVVLLGMNPYLALILAVPIMFVFGYVFQHVVIRPLFLREKADSNPVGLLLCTAGLGIALENIMLMIFKSTPRSISMGISLTYVPIGFGRKLSLVKIIGAGIAVAVVAIVWIYMNKTYSGKALRATSQDREAAQMMGINVLKCYNVAFGIGCAICAVAGVIFSTFYTITPSVGTTIGSKAFSILVLGGKGSVGGCLIAGLIIGLVEAFGGLFFDSYTGQMLCFVIFVLMLYFKPNGLFGKKV